MRIAEWLLKNNLASLNDASKALDGVPQIQNTGTSSASAYTSRTARNLATFGYLNNITVYRAVNVLAQACASIEWQVFSKGQKRVEIPDHPVALLLNQPNSDQSRGMFI